MKGVGELGTLYVPLPPDQRVRPKRTAQANGPSEIDLYNVNDRGAKGERVTYQGKHTVSLLYTKRSILPVLSTRDLVNTHRT